MKTPRYITIERLWIVILCISNCRRESKRNYYCEITDATEHRLGCSISIYDQQHRFGGRTDCGCSCASRTDTGFHIASLSVRFILHRRHHHLLSASWVCSGPSLYSVASACVSSYEHLISLLFWLFNIPCP